jgi:hypothetical protein
VYFTVLLSLKYTMVERATTKDDASEHAPKRPRIDNEEDDLGEDGEEEEMDHEEEGDEDDLDDEDDDDDEMDPSRLDGNTLALMAWEHYRIYLDSLTPTGCDHDGDDSCDHNHDVDNQGDLDALHAIVQLVAHFRPPTDTLAVPPLEYDKDGQQPHLTIIESWKEPVDALPALMSVVATILGETAMGACVQLRETSRLTHASVCFSDMQRCFHLAWHHFPYHAETWSLAANWGRMTHSLSVSQIATWYQYAAHQAHALRASALRAIEQLEQARARAALQKDSSLNNEEEQEDDDASDKEGDTRELLLEWIEAVVLHQMCGVEWEGDDDDDDSMSDDDENKEVAHDKECDDVKHRTKSDQTVVVAPTNGTCNSPVERDTSDAQRVDDNTSDGSGWTVPAVESTTRFMAALQWSIAQRHDLALQQLTYFDPPLTHRLHPHVWQRTSSHSSNSNSDAFPSRIDGIPSEPVVFRGDSTKGVLPSDVYQRVCDLFAPQAEYWSQTDYIHRGYYSFFQDRHGHRPSHLIDDVIQTFLLPRVCHYMDGTTSQNNNNDTTLVSDSIVGYEWWVHTRPIASNLGHNLHFDTDESMLFRERKVTYPLVSSVLYLTGGDSGAGETIVLDQTAESTENATVGWKCTPRNNAFLCFPGQLLHGVLPCPGTPSDSSDIVDTTLLDKESLPNPEDVWKLPTKEPASSSKDHRLTLMVGFWTRRVPDQMTDCKLYGPCGPLPPLEDTQHSWVQSIHQGYDSELLPQQTSPVTTTVESMEPVPSVSPVWETLPPVPTSKKDAEGPRLRVPKALDHRYFVHNAPHCFRESLFEGDEFDELNESTLLLHHNEKETSNPEKQACVLHPSLNTTGPEATSCGCCPK